jgi:hypothetical protein
MGLFDKLNNQLEINDVKERLYEEDEMKRIEQMLIFEGYKIDNYLLEIENNNNGWTSYAFNRIDNPWSKKMSDIEKEEYRKDREMTREQDRQDRIAAREIEKTAAADEKHKEKISKLQEEYDEEFEYIRTKTIRILKQYKEDHNDISSRSETKPDGTTDPAKVTKKREDLHDLKETYKKLMRKQKDQYDDLNSDRRYREVKKSKIRAEYFELDTTILP